MSRIRVDEERGGAESVDAEHERDGLRGDVDAIYSGHCGGLFVVVWRVMCEKVWQVGLPKELCFRRRLEEVVFTTRGGVIALKNANSVKDVRRIVGKRKKREISRFLYQ